MSVNMWDFIQSRVSLNSIQIEACDGKRTFQGQRKANTRALVLQIAPIK